MQTQAISERNSGRSYREFSRRRYNELKNMRGQHMRESEIIQRIIKEWDQIQITNRNKRSNRDGFKVPATPMKDGEKMVPLEIKDQKLLRSTNAKKEEEGNEERSSFEHELNNVMVRPFDSPAPMSKEKKIQKASKGSKYITFYRRCYADIMEKHPNWTSTQATVIIKLMWMNEKSKSGRKSVQKPAKVAKRMSGRMAFKKFKMLDGLKTQEIKTQWKKLPFESKLMWTMKGNPQMSEKGARMPEMKMKLNQLIQIQNKGMESLNSVMMKKIA